MSTLFELPQLAPAMFRDATFNKDGTKRVHLLRRWEADGEHRFVCFVMLNPSTANAEKDDPTIRKCIAFAKAWGYGALHVVNLFDFITPSPLELRAWVGVHSHHPRRHEPLDLQIIRETSATADMTVCGWGTWGGWFPERAREVYGVLTAPHALHVTKDGHPGHPLYLPASLRPQPFIR